MQVIPAEPDKKRETPKVESQNVIPIKREPIKVEANQSESTEDIYEFKEPEPFEFEVRNKRDSGGSTGSTTDKDKEIEKEKDIKDKPKKRTFEEDKSPKKRQKTFGGTTSAVTISPSAVKVEQKSETSPPDQPSTDPKKKVRKIFKKSEEVEEPDAEGDDGNATATRDLSKLLPANYSGVMVFKRKEPTPAAARNNDESAATTTVTVVENSTDSPKKRQPKTFGSPAASAKSNDSKTEPCAEEIAGESKKKVRKIFSKQADENDEIEETMTGNSSKAPSRKDDGDASWIGDSVGSQEKPKKAVDEDASKNPKKRQKTYRRVIIDNYVEVPPSITSATTRDHATKYFSHYSGPKTKAAAIASENDSVQDRPATLSKSEVQARNEPSKSSPISVNILSSHDKDEEKSKTSELSASTSASVDNKQASTSSDKKRVPDPGAPAGKAEPKEQLKTLDFTPIVPHTLPVPAPISARLPATASIEEKLSAAAVFRSKLEDTKKVLDSTPRKTLKDMTTRKAETLPAKKVKEKEDNKIKQEPEKKKLQIIEPSIQKKDPLQEIEIRKDPLLEVIKKKEDEILKVKKESETKVPVPMPNTTVTKTYGSQRKDTATKVEETWKKSAATLAASTTASNLSENASSDLPNSDPIKDYVVLRKETIVSKIKSSIDRDSVDSTDSSDSERRLTIIDSEDLPEDKCNDSSSDVKSKTGPIAVSSSQFNAIVQQQQQRASPAVPSHIEVHPQIRGVGVTPGVQAVIIEKSTKMEEDGENLNSLLCEEEIPGSPTPGSEPMDQEHRANSSHNLAKSDMGRFY